LKKDSIAMKLGIIPCSLVPIMWDGFQRITRQGNEDLAMNLAITFSYICEAKTNGEAWEFQKLNCQPIDDMYEHIGRSQAVSTPFSMLYRNLYISKPLLS